MAIAELARPGVEVIQSIRTTSPTFLRPTLAPVVVGPAFEVINVLTSDSTINSKALYGSYGQVGRTITQSSFPSPRDNIDEVDVLSSSIRSFLLTGGKLSELLMGPGEGFLIASNVAAQAQLYVTGVTFALHGLNVVLAVDQPTDADTTADVTVSFPGSSVYTPADIVAVINAAFGFKLASITYDTDGVTATGVLLASPSFGALSSLTVRAGGTANSVLGIGWDGTNHVGIDERVEGAGYRAYNLSNNTTVSPWIEFHRGDYLANGTSAGESAWPEYAGQANVITGVVLSAKVPAITFGGSSFPIQAGDQIFADGVRLQAGEISVVTSSRFRLSTVDAALSTADASGRYITKVYDDAPVGLIIDTTPFAPKYVWFKATGLVPTVAATAATISSSAATAAVAATVEGATAPNFGSGITLTGLHIDSIVTADGVSTLSSFVFTSDTPYATMAGVAADIHIAGLLASADSGKLKFTTSKTGRLQAVTIKGTSSAATVLGLGSSDLSDTGTDASFTSLAGTNLRFTLDGGTHVYNVGFLYDSLDLAVDAINGVVGSTVASKNSGGTELVLTSMLASVASLVTIVDGTSLTPLGFIEDESSSPGTGRPDPDAYLDSSDDLVIGPDIIRDPMTGYPLDFDTSSASLYIQYKGLRRDVSSSAQVAGLLTISDTDTLSSVLDPVTEANPLSLAIYLALLNCPGFEVRGLGVDEVSASASEGTELAYARAASFLEAQEVYAIAPLSQNEVVHSTFITHVTLMSEPEQMGERIVLFNKAQPARRSPTLVASGVSANSTATPNQLVLDVTPQSGLISAGLDPSKTLSVSNGAYIQFTWNGLFYRYSVSSVSGGQVNLRTTFTTRENDDLFYSTDTLPTGIIDASWAMDVRGASLNIPGSNPAKPDYSLVAQTVAEANNGFGNRRAYSLFPNTVKTTISGIEKEIPGYYACAVVAGMIAGLPPQQGFTNYPMTGLTGVVGTEHFTKRQLNQMAGGGTYILMQEVQGGSVFCRHQLSTDTSSIETRELSITKIVDFVAKFLRVGIRRFIGRQNITSVFLDTVGTTIQAMLHFLQDNGIINGSSLNNIIQDSTEPDTVMIDVTLDIPYPCNYIRLTLVV